MIKLIRHIKNRKDVKDEMCGPSKDILNESKAWLHTVRSKRAHKQINDAYQARGIMCETENHIYDVSAHRSKYNFF